MRLPTFVCLLARLLKNAWMDLDEMLHVDRGRDMEELINFWAQSRSQSRCRNQKIDDVSKSVKQAPHSNHVMHCRKILFTPRCSPRAREFLRSVDFSVRRTVVELRGVKVAQFSDFGLFSPYKTPKTYLPVTSLQLQRMIQIFPCDSRRSRGVLSGTRDFLRLLVGNWGPSNVPKFSPMANGYIHTEG